jgi:hypothetical protein
MRLLRITETHDYDLIGTLLPATERNVLHAARASARADQYQPESTTRKFDEMPDLQPAGAARR